MIKKAKNSFRNEKIGLLKSTALVAGNMIGSGIFLLPAALASFGSISLIGWLVSILGAFFIARVFSNLSILLPGITGGPYAYARTGCGDFAGFLTGWSYYISVVTSNAALTISFVGALTAFIPSLQHQPGRMFFTGLVTVWLVTWINLRGITFSAKVQLVTTVLKIIPLLFIGTAGLFFIQLENFHPFATPGRSIYNSVAATATLTMFSFLGVESATIPSARIHNPRKNIPLATMLGLFICAVAYLLPGLSIMGMFPARELQHSVTPFADTASRLFGNHAAYWVSAGVAIAALGALNGWTLMQGHLPYAMARDQLFPSVFKKVNNKEVPVYGVVLSSALVSLLLGMNYTSSLVNQFQFLLLLTVIATLVPYLFSTAAYLLLQFKRNRVSRPKGSIAVGIIAFLYSLWLIAGAGREAIYSGCYS